MATYRNRIGTGAATRPCDYMRPSRVSFPGSIVFKLCAGMVMLASVLLPEYVAAGDVRVYLQPAERSLPAPQGVPAQSAIEARANSSGSHNRAYFGREPVSREARQIADWIVDSADNHGLPFVVVDKVKARIFVFDAGGRIQGAAPALLGIARGDNTVPGIGDREFADMPPETRTTPAGRFVSALGMDTRGEDVVWVDYEAAVSLHRVITTKPEERRLERLASPRPLDHRISYGCINVPARFYETVVRPAFIGTDGIVYVLPETLPAHEVFRSYDVEERLTRLQAGQSVTSK